MRRRTGQRRPNNENVCSKTSCASNCVKVVMKYLLVLDPVQRRVLLLEKKPITTM